MAASPAVTAAVLAAATAAATIRWRAGAPGTGAVAVALVAAWALAGSVLTRRRPEDPAGAVVTAGAALGGAATLAGAWEGALPSLVAGVAAGLLPAVLAHLLVALGHGSQARRGHAVAVGCAYGLGAATAVVAWARGASLPPVAGLAELAVAGLVGTALAKPGYDRAPAGRRRQLQWFAAATVALGGVAIVTLALHLLVSWPPQPGEVIAVASLAVPASLAVGTGARLAPAGDRAVVAATSLAGLAALVAAVYVAVVIGLGRVPAGGERTVLALSMAAAALTAVLYVPARQRLGEVAARFAYGERRPPDEALRTFGARLSRALPLEELLLQLAESLRASLGLARVEVWTGGDGELRRTVSLPERGSARLSLSPEEEAVLARAGVSGPAWAGVWLPALDADDGAVFRVTPVVNSGRVLGLVVTAKPVDAEPFSAAEEEALGELGRQVGLALHNARLDSALQASLDELRRKADELQASRARVVAAGDAARRRIERDLHDGAQQRLVALAVNARLAARLAESDPRRAKAAADQLACELQEALQQLRDLAHGIYPPLLADRGLRDALGAAAQRCPLAVTVRAKGVGRHPPAVEAAVYFCCLEALQNAAKHAGAGAEVHLTVREEAAGLVFEVRDDGVGFDPTEGGVGVGFVNMADRLGAVGGSVRVDSVPGKGTRVTGTVPLGRDCRSAPDWAPS